MPTVSIGKGNRPAPLVVRFVFPALTWSVTASHAPSALSTSFSYPDLTWSLPPFSPGRVAQQMTHSEAIVNHRRAELRKRRDIAMRANDEVWRWFQIS